MLAGVVMNVVLAVVVYTGLAFHYPRIVYPSTVVGGVAVAQGPAELAQIHPGDTILSVNAERVKSWNDIVRLIGTSSGSTTITTQRGDAKIPIGRAPDAPQRIIEALRPFARPVIDTVFAGDPAAVAGLRHGDSLVSVSGKTIRTWGDMVDEVSASPEKRLSLVISRGGAPETLSITPKSARDTDPVSGVERTVGKIGAGTAYASRSERLGLAEALSVGVENTWSNAGFVFKILHGIGTGVVSVKELGGPVAITRASVDAARTGFDVLFKLIALLSINVAVLNLLPIPILDGGQILINVLEAAKGKPFSLRAREYILRFGLVAIGLLFAIVMYNDLHTDVRDGLAKLFGWVGKLFGA
jgi:regulator of sigma E protease